MKPKRTIRESFDQTWRNYVPVFSRIARRLKLKSPVLNEENLNSVRRRVMF